MAPHVTFLLLGLANGAVYAALAMGLVVTHRSAKVLNLSVSAMALLTGTIYGSLRQGDLLIPLPFLPDRVHLTSSMGFAPAAALALGITAVVGLLVHVLVFRPLRHAPPVTAAVASLGLSVVIVSTLSEKFGSTSTTSPPIFPPGQWTLGQVTVAKERILFALAVLIMSMLMWGLWRFTRFGLLSRAVSQSEKGSFVVGVPVERIAAANWVVSALIAGVAGILMSPIVAPVPINYALFIVPALAVATLGRFEYLGPAVWGGLALGMVQSEMTYLQAQFDWFPASGTQEFVPLLLILVVLVARAKPLPSRGVIQERRPGRAPCPRNIGRNCLLSLAAGSAAVLTLQNTYRAALIVSLIYVLIALSQVVVTGLSGQISLAQLTLAGVAGFSLGQLTTSWHVPFPIAPILAALVATIVGVLFALPAVRIRGLSVAVVTLALAVALEAVWFRNTDVVSSAGQAVGTPNLFGLDLGMGVGVSYPRWQFGLLVLVLCVVIAAGVAKLRTSRLGGDMLAVRANEKSAAAAGVNVVRTKIAAFAIGAFIAGLGGALLAYSQGNVTVDSFYAYLGLSVFALAYVGGITSVTGAVIAGLLASEGLLVQMLGFLSFGGWFVVLSGVGLVYTVIQNPEGLAGPLHNQLSRLRHKPTSTTIHTTIEDRTVTSLHHQQGGMPRPRPGEVALSVIHLAVNYGGVRAVADVSFDVRAGSITGLIGPNGAGKTTLLDAISGFVDAEGDVVLNGQPLQRYKPHERAKQGLGRTFQSIELYEDLSVRENIAVGLSSGGQRASSDALDATLGVLGLVAVADMAAGELSQGTRQLVSIGRAIAGTPRVLLLDEPAAGLDSAESRWLGQRLRELRDSGIAILIVDHDLHLMLEICDQMHVLDFGELIASGPPAQVRNDPKVKAAYIGGSEQSESLAGPASEHKTGQEDLTVDAGGKGRSI